MTKRQAYLELAKKYICKKYDSYQTDYVCSDLEKLLGCGVISVADAEVEYPELRLFRNPVTPIAWLSELGSSVNVQQEMAVKATILLFAIEILKDEKKVQKKSKTRNLR